MVDRFAPPKGNSGTPCSTADRVYCGGTWETLISQLDYIQRMGYDAVWISPTGLNLEGNTVYGEAYHVSASWLPHKPGDVSSFAQGYWTADPTQLNPHFGADSDLKALSSALHGRGMYLMVDIAINALASLSTNISDSALQSDDSGTLLFKQTANYHQSCNIDWGDHDSEMDW